MNKHIRKVLHKIYIILGEYLDLAVDYDWEKEPDIKSYPEHVYITKGDSLTDAVNKAEPGTIIYVMREEK